ncbi:MAG TPA: tRNA (N6-isopentenyl adenosine(37)-C2)-methylthiotransferase MiaB [Terriglobales bacterium]|nr:tRNA (N6-isopentenyl adenosine(37)-C2)-methylthiotransferase MiaB [Terriglobales bacterium]
MPRVYIETYGCQMNVADSEILIGHLGRSGYQRTDDPAAADVLLINTCAIREHAEERVIGRLGTLAQFKTLRPAVQLGIAGCMAQHVRDKLLDRLPWVDFVVGPDAYRRLPQLLLEGGENKLIDVRLDKDETYADLEPERAAGVRGWVTVMRGCDKFCTFCIVPYVRGRERSLPADAILSQIETLVAGGAREVVLLGQTVNAYRDGHVDFAELLRRTNAIAGLRRIRFTSPHPADISDAVIEAMASCDKVCPQLHLPVQSGSNRVLQRMERGYTVEHYLELVDKLRGAIPELALSTDIIVGFPGEEAEDFAATEALMQRVAYDSAFMFKYSARSHTKAGKWPETVSEEEKTRRLQAIIAIQNQHSQQLYRRAIDTTVEVLVEGPARRPEGWWMGKSPQFKTVIFAGNGLVAGELVPVRITDATQQTLIGIAGGGERGPL